MDKRIGEALVGGLAAWMIAGMALFGARPATAQAADPLWGLELEKGRLSWDGVALGHSLVQAERKIGTTLAVEPSSDSGPCAPYVARSDHHGLSLTLGFRSPKPGAKIEWLRVRFEGAQVMASASDLVAALRVKFPAAEWIRPSAPADLVEADDLAPSFVIPGGKEPQAVRFAPREAMLLAAPACLD